VDCATGVFVDVAVDDPGAVPATPDEAGEADNAVEAADVPANADLPRADVTGAVPATGPIPNIVGISDEVAFAGDAFEVTGAVPATGPMPSIVGISAAPGAALASEEVAAFAVAAAAAGVNVTRN
jgi:hypothetical protein